MQTNSDALDVFAESETKNSVAVNNKMHTKGVPGFQGRLSSLFVVFFHILALPHTERSRGDSAGENH